MAEWHDVLFGDAFYDTDPDMPAKMEEARQREAARVAAVKAEAAARKAAREANRCPKCSGSGYLSAFAYHKCGECFTCGGTGVFTRFAA